ncbi:STAS domain-containing protein [Polyangium sorediatum]|uniref:STAS domain-containing protein n=1 Tax=Polyangium sorediatum TaxID=889274 RepID=A0ABT6NM93_9BACT|nr:STAS domain-containing protein [Polyangium sorediatum]MDI1429421.1 STAS domain-containing protein [Polyangium sorediatum]
MQRVINAFWERIEDNVTESCARVEAAEVPFYRSLPAEVRRGAFKRAFEAMGHDLAAEAAQAFPTLLAVIGEQRSGLGVRIVDILRGMAMGFDVVTEDFATLFADDLEARLHWERVRARVSYMGAATLADAYLGAREKLVRAQAEEILQLSARVLPLYPGILVLPLVGALDAARAAHLTPLLLQAVVENQSRVVLLDVTGLPAVGAEAAEHLMGAARGVELLGATPILVGVRPHMARTMVEAGVDLGRLRSRADLASGLRDALDALGLAIARKR